MIEVKVPLPTASRMGFCMPRRFRVFFWLTSRSFSFRLLAQRIVGVWGESEPATLTLLGEACWSSHLSAIQTYRMPKPDPKPKSQLQRNWHLEIAHVCHAFITWPGFPETEVGVAQNSRARVTRVLVFGSIRQGAILVPAF